MSVAFTLPLSQWKNKLLCLTEVSAYTLLPPHLKIAQQNSQVTFLIEVTMSLQSRLQTAIPAMVRVRHGYELVRPELPQT